MPQPRQKAHSCRESLFSFRLDSLELFLNQPVDACCFPSEMLKPSHHFHPRFCTRTLDSQLLLDGLGDKLPQGNAPLRRPGFRTREHRIGNFKGPSSQIQIPIFMGAVASRRSCYDGVIFPSTTGRLAPVADGRFDVRLRKVSYASTAKATASLASASIPNSSDLAIRTSGKNACR